MSKGGDVIVVGDRPARDRHRSSSPPAACSRAAGADACRAVAGAGISRELLQ